MPGQRDTGPPRNRGPTNVDAAHGEGGERLHEWMWMAGEGAELIPEGKPVAGAVTHLRYRVVNHYGLRPIPA